MPVLSTVHDGLPDLKPLIPQNQRKVMVVEDEAIIALDIQKQLIQAGFAVTGRAQTALRGFHLIEREKPDIVLMDIGLKGDMDGVQAASMIRSRYGLPVIYLTALSDDATLNRARMTEPYGFLVKPIEHTDLKAAITMALYKHQMERKLEMNRRLLSTILRSLTDAIIVADPTGGVLFMNHAAEQMTGWSLAEASAKTFFQIATIQDDQDREVSCLLVQQTIAEGTPIQIPGNCMLTTRYRQRIGVSGQLSVMAIHGQLTGVFISLRDTAALGREGQVPNQERQMLILSQFAQEAACVFDSVFDLIENTVNGLRKESNEGLDLIRNASRVGSGFSAQLLEMGEGYGAAHVVNVKQYLSSSQSLLKRLCGVEIPLELSSSTDFGYILSTGNHFEQLLVNLVRQGVQQQGQGSLLLGADVRTQRDLSGRSGSCVRLFLKVETTPANDAAFEDSSSFGPESPRIGLAIVRAIAAASGGFVLLTEPSKSVSMIEVFLPRHTSRISATNATNEHSNVILLVRLEPDVAESLKRSLRDDVLFLEASSPDEAICISELYDGDIDLIVVEEGCFERGPIDRARRRIRDRRPGIPFMQSSGGDAMEQRVMKLLYGRTQAVAGAPNQ